MVVVFLCWGKAGHGPHQHCTESSRRGRDIILGTYSGTLQRWRFSRPIGGMASITLCQCSIHWAICLPTTGKKRATLASISAAVRRGVYDPATGCVAFDN